MVPMMGQGTNDNSAAAISPSFPPNPYGSYDNRPPSSYGYHSPYGAPLTPVTTHSHSSASKDGAPTDEEYFANLQKYPYLLNSYLSKPKAYESPYPLGGGFSAVYNPSLSAKQGAEPHSHSAHTPQGSVSSTAHGEGRDGQPWTPPSQVWDRVGLANGQPPPGHQAIPPQTRYPQPTYSTPQEFQRQIQSMPSTASRDGAHARMLRDQGYMQYQAPHWYQRNSFGQPYDTARLQHSPKAPTPSPLSDPNTPGQTPGAPRHQQGWGEVAPNLGYAPPQFPPMQPGGVEIWRYN